MKIILMRHAATDDNLVKRYSGNNDDIGINDEGVEQVANVAKLLKTKNIHIIYTSPFRRCIETAEILKKLLGVKFDIVDNLKEVNYGRWQGLTSLEAKIKYPKVYKARGLDPANVAPPSGETLKSMQKRVLKVVEDIIIKGKTSLVVTHGSCIHAVLMYCLNENLSEFWSFNQKYKLSNCSISEICVSENSEVRVEKVEKIGYSF